MVDSASTPQPVFSICVPSYNRASLLDGLFANLARVRGPTFELVIVNDGSTDDTAATLARLEQLAPFVCQIITIPHGGLGPALNAAFDQAQGEFIIIMDDDDLLREDCLEKALAAWSSIPVDQRASYCGVCGLCEFEDGKVVGQKFPKYVEDSDYFTIRMRRNVRGDKKEVVTRAALNGFRFRVVGTERRAIKNMLWFSLARSYKTRFINEVLMTKGRRGDGITAHGRRLKVDSPNLTAEYNLSLLRWFPSSPFWLKLRFYKDYMRYRWHAGDTIDAAARHLPSPLLAALLKPLSLRAARSDLRKLGRPVSVRK